INFICVVFLGMDVVGVALGTIVAQYASAVAILIIFVKSDSEIKLSLKKLKLHKAELKQITIVGFPAGINGAMFSLSNVILQSAVNSFGQIVMAANSVAANYSNFAYILVAAGEQACISFVGQNMGAKKYERIGKTVSIALWVTGIAVAVYSAVVVFDGRFFLGLFTNDSAVIDYGLNYLYVVILPYVLIMPSVVLGGALRGMGYAMTQTVISLVFICLVRIMWVNFILPLNNIYEMVFISYPVTWVLAAVATWIAYIVAKKRSFDNIK
ncbi:MAG: hypothetical protein IJN96_07040, partial [Clostridia bacterium]|nr:hypothetical protein [Clostridia bacterium]